MEQSVAQGTHYCDITGEVPWVKRSFMQNNKAATEKGVKIVHCCGYDRCGGKADQADRPLTIHAPAFLPHSIPSDLGTHMMVEYIK